MFGFARLEVAGVLAIAAVAAIVMWWRLDLTGVDLWVNVGLSAVMAAVGAIIGLYVARKLGWAVWE